ncbi:MAG: hypothetical protein HW377_2477 [Actinobacteria bacterium]|nr:hypothetical protein [Actinomycetota bacterium]
MTRIGKRIGKIRNPCATRKVAWQARKMATCNYTINVGKMARPRGFEPLAT